MNCAPSQTPEFTTFKFPNADDFRAECDRVGIQLPWSDDLSILAEPITIAGRTLANRYAIQPMEGVDSEPDGSPSELTRRRYQRFAGGGASLLWFEAVSVVRAGRSIGRQLWITPDNVDSYKRLVDETRAIGRAATGRDPMIICQLTHSGRWSRPDGTPAPIIAQRIPALDSATHGAEQHYVTDDEFDAMQEDFLRAAKLAMQAGFDGVDFKVVHGYLLAELLGAHERPGKYGGSYANRTRFLREGFVRMRSELGPRAVITSRLTLLEPSPFPHGWGVKPEIGSTDLDLSEPSRLYKELIDWGAPVTNVSLGHPRYQPHLNRPHDQSLAGIGKPPEHPLVGVRRFIDMTAHAQRLAPQVPLLSAGLSWLRQHIGNVGAGMVKEGMCGFLGLGRMAFALPDTPKQLMTTGKLEEKAVCITCSMCSQIMKDGVAETGCVVRDKALYAPKYALGRKAAKAKGLA